MPTAVFLDLKDGVRAIDTAAMRLSHMRKRVTAWQFAMNDLLDKQRVRAWKITLTYRGVLDWSPNHIKQFMAKIRYEFGDKYLASAWVAELQERGAVHYHVCLILMPDCEVPKLDAAGWWLHGSTSRDVLKAVSAEYLMKYGQKTAQKGNFPKGLRLFACVIRPCGKKLVTDLNYYEFRLAALPGYVRSAVRKLVTEVPVDFKVSTEKLRKGWWWSPLLAGGWLIGFYNFWRKIETNVFFIGIEGTVYADRMTDRLWALE